MSMIPSNTTQQQGFTLIEILVAMSIMAIGLLGMVGMQGTGMRQTYNADLLTQATYQANDMVERMRTNSIALKEGAYDAVNGSEQDPNCQPNCTPVQMAQLDAALWAETTRQLLHGLDENGDDNGSVNTAVTNNGDGTFSVTIGWNEFIKEGAEQQNYSLRVQL